jgi:hypothetical protein
MRGHAMNAAWANETFEGTLSSLETYACGLFAALNRNNNASAHDLLRRQSLKRN